MTLKLKNIIKVISISIIGLIYVTIFTWSMFNGIHLRKNYDDYLKTNEVYNIQEFKELVYNKEK